MEKIGIKQLLLEALKEDYNQEKNRNNKLNRGITLIEASIKLVTIMTLSIIKEKDFEEYMKLSKSLQDLTLGKYYVTLRRTKVDFEMHHRLFDEFQSIFAKTIEVELELPNSILENQSQRVKPKAFLTETKRVADGIDNLLLYGVEFRNIFKGHSAVIKENDTKLFDKVFGNLDILIKEYERVIDAIFEIEGLEFYIADYDQRYKKMIMRDNQEEYPLSPMLVYSYCNLYECHNNPKLYFVNRLNNSEAQYLDYLFNHPFTLKTKENEWEIGTLQKSSKELNREINYSNREKYKELSSVFIGRKEELKKIKKHILNNYDHYNTLTIITGKAGIGKSAFVTQLQAIIDEEREKDISYLFYAIKNQNTDNELKKFTESVKKYLEKNIHFTKKDRHKKSITELFEVVEKSNPKKTLLLIIDGLDEFDNVVKFLYDLNLSEVKQSNNIHIILTSRPYQNVLRTLKDIVSKLKNFKVYNPQQVETKGYAFELESLTKEETKSLVLEMLPREIATNTHKHSKIINTIINKSESLPIYIYYISRMLEEKSLGNQENYVQRLTKWVDELPPKLEDYYIRTFTDIKPLSRKILIAIYFSNYGASFNELYHIFKRDDIDKIAFEHEYFSEIEMFLKEYENDYYLFYHLSAKDAIFRYYIKEQEDISMFDTDEYIKKLIPQKEGRIELKRFFKDSNYYEKLDHLFSYIFTIKSDCDFNETLRGIIDTVIAKQDSLHLQRFLKKSFFHIFYNYCLASIVTFNTQKSNQKSLKLTKKMIQDVSKFLKIFEAVGDKENTEIIAYAYKLSRLIGDHQKSLRYYDMYTQANLQTFIRICSDINRVGHIEEFKSKLDNWENELSVEQKDILVKMLALSFEIDEAFLEIYEKLSEKYQKQLNEALNFD